MAQKKKEKTSKIRREFSAGGVVFKKLTSGSKKAKIVWLIAKSKPSNDYPQSLWRLPKGWLDDRDGGKFPGPFASGEKKAGKILLENAALREVEEEGGINAKIVKKISTEKYFYKNKSGEKILKFVTFYLMKYASDVEVGFGFETSDVAWLSYSQARAKLAHSRERKVLDKAKKLFEESRG